MKYVTFTPTADPHRVCVAHDNETGGSPHALFDAMLYGRDPAEGPSRNALNELLRLAHVGMATEAGDYVERDSIIEALRDAARNDSAADGVAFVSDLVGWQEDEDEELVAERAEDDDA